MAPNSGSQQMACQDFGQHFHSTHMLPFSNKEALKDRFWDCIQAQWIWRWVLQSLFELNGTRNTHSMHLTSKIAFMDTTSKKGTKLELEFGIFSKALLCGLFELHITTRFSIKSNGVNQNLRTLFEESASFMVKLHGERLSHILRDALRRRPSYPGNSNRPLGQGAKGILCWHCDLMVS